MTKDIIQEMINRTYRELEQAKNQKPVSRSRMWQSTNGYIYLVPWSNACLLRVLVRKFTHTLPKSEYRLKAQADDAARSVVANIEEGFSRPTTKEYLDYLGFSFASLKEVKEDVQRSLQDGFIKSVKGSSLAGLGINLTDWHEALKKSVISRPAEDSKESYRSLKEIKGNYRKLEEIRGKSPLNFFKFLYSPVDNLLASDLTYEIFIELINKTDWHLRKLVESLEKKLSDERKFYQVEQARIRSRM